MSEQQPVEPGQPAPPDESLMPAPTEPTTGPAAGAPMGAPMGFQPAWMPPPPPAPVPMWNRIAAYIVLIAVVAAAAGAGIGWSLARAVNPQTAQSNAPQSPIVAATPSTGPVTGNTSADAIAAKVDPAIVDINTTIGTSAAAGTGMIISSSGEILTNNHVVTGSSSITVALQGRSQTYTAHVVGVDISQDVALIQIDQNVSGLPTVTLANSSSLQVGDTVVAIGNALGQGGAPHATQGQITDLNQTITASEGGGQSETLNGMIQSDAVIYEGDSGGPLVNTAGQVVGMITAGQAQGFRSSASNVGYAIPVNTALDVVNRIRARDQGSDLTYTQQGYMGVQVQTLDAAGAAQLGVNVSAGAVVVATPAPGSPAADAGIPRYAVITSVGGTAVTSADSLGPAIKSHQPGDKVSVTWVTPSGSHTATVTLAGVNP
jgi:S1-C subfamily serine protease